MTPEKYLAKASHAAKSASILLREGEAEGACNRAYYAMFNAAHAALLWSGAHVNSGLNPPRQVRRQRDQWIILMKPEDV